MEIAQHKLFTALRDAGFTKVRNLNGGIIAWANEIDPEMATY